MKNYCIITYAKPDVFAAAVYSMSYINLTEEIDFIEKDIKGIVKGRDCLIYYYATGILLFRFISVEYDGEKFNLNSFAVVKQHPKWRRLAGCCIFNIEIIFEIVVCQKKNKMNY